MRIFPCAKVRRNIFSYPDKEGDQEKCDGHGHTSNMRRYREFHPNAPKYSEDEWDEDPSRVREIVVCKKVDVNSDRERRGDRVANGSGELNLHDAPGLADVASYGRVHKSAVERNGGNFQHSLFGIRPRADVRVCFVELKDEAKEMEEGDCLDFVFGFDLCCVEDDLDRDGCDKEDIVSVKWAERDVLREKKQRKK